MEIVTRPRIEAWSWLFFGSMFLIGAAESLVIEGLEGAVYLTLLAAAFGSVALLVSRDRTFCRAAVDEEGVTLRPEWQGWFAARPFSFRWEEVRKVRRWPLFARNPHAGLPIMLDRPKRFWTFQGQPANRVTIPPAIARSADFVEALRQRVPAERIAAGALDFQAVPHSMRRRVIGALILLACAGWAAWGVAQLIRGGSFINAMMPLVAGYLGCLLLSLCTELSAAAGLLAGTWIAALFCANIFMVLSFLGGPSPATAGYLSANVAALLGAMILVLKGPVRWRHAALFYALVAIGFVAGRSLYGGIPDTRVAAGHLSMWRQNWTPSGDGFVISTATLITGTQSGPVDMQWYEEDLRPENRLTLPNDSEVRAVGQEGAVALIRTREGAELWFLPRRSGPARRLTAAEALTRFHESPSKRFLVFCREGKVEESWERCDVETGDMMHFDVPPAMKGAWARWGKDDSTIIWIAGQPPRAKNGRLVEWNEPLPPNGAFAQPGELYRVWVWKAGAAPMGYQAKTQWLWSHYSARDERLYVGRVAEDAPLRKEFVAIDFSGPEPAVVPTTEKVIAESSQPLSAPTRRYEVLGGESLKGGRACVEDTVTGKRRFLRRGLPFMGSSSDLAWSPRGSEFLMTCVEWRLPQDFWQWRRDPMYNLMNGATVYLVVVE